jgi:hypothetical protein
MDATLSGLNWFQAACTRAKIIKLRSTIGDAAHEIFVDMNPTGPNSYFIIQQISHTETSGVAKDMSAFLCDNTLVSGGNPLLANGTLNQSQIGVYVGEEGSNSGKFGSLLQIGNTGGGFLIVPPNGWFLRFCTTGAGGFPGNGSFDSIQILYAEVQIPCSC